MALFHTRGWLSIKTSHTDNLKAGADLLENVLVKETAPGSGIVIEAVTIGEAIGYVTSPSGGLNGEKVDVLLYEEFHEDPGTGSSATNSIYNETPTGLINDVNTVYTLSQTPSGNSLQLFLNGQLLTGGGEDYTRLGTTVTFIDPPQTGGVLRAFYVYV